MGYFCFHNYDCSRGKSINVISDMDLTVIKAYGNWCMIKREHFQEYIHINLDSLHTRNEERLRLEECIRDHLSFVVDNTNPTVDDRSPCACVDSNLGK